MNLQQGCILLERTGRKPVTEEADKNSTKGKG